MSSEQRSETKLWLVPTSVVERFEVLVEAPDRKTAIEKARAGEVIKSCYLGAEPTRASAAFREQ